MLLNVSQIRRCMTLIVPAVLVFGLSDLISAGDRTFLHVPLRADAGGGTMPDGIYPDEAFGDAASHGWRAYLRLWKAHREDPADPMIRRFLGLPLDGEFVMKAKRGSSAPRWLRWKAGTYAQVDTTHFVIHSQSGKEPSTRLARDLERCYWVWTQMFFPLWEARAQVSAALADMGEDQSVTDYLEESGARITIRRKLRVVLFRDADQYRRALAPTYPGIERSTGFYDNGKQTIFLYAADSDDAATRRHELVHQLFREATRSALGRDIPGEKQEFWLVEGIAGYFESLRFADRFATVGGWDSSRLQFARYRVLGRRDEMPMSELRVDGRVAAQERQDLARWYAHSIARSHQLLDGGNVEERQWLYQQLATLYRVKADLPELDEAAALQDIDRRFTNFLKIDDARIADNPIVHPGQIRELVFSGCEISAMGLSNVPPLPSVEWLDLGRTRAAGNGDVLRIAPRPQVLQQLTLEVTGIDSGLKDWLAKASDLREVDLSFTKVDDTTVDAVSKAKELTVLWLTGTKVSDRAIDSISQMKKLESVDLQRTDVSAQGIAKLRQARPNLQVNPLVLK